jgi:hypothetical protein
MELEASSTSAERRIFQHLAAQSERPWTTLIGCLFTGIELPQYCEPMAREPAAPVGDLLNGGFAVVLDRALRLNPANHDGAILFGRSSHHESFTLRGWSYRLFPPKLSANCAVNRGSAYNSCLGMSLVSHVLSVYLISGETLTEFQKGASFQISV